MKRKILTIIASVLIIATFGILLTACSKTGYVSVSEVNAGVERENDYGAAKATKLNVGDYDVVDSSTESNYLIMSSVTVGDTGQETVYYVVDAKTNKALYSGKDRPYLLRLSGGGIIWDDVFFTLQICHFVTALFISFHCRSSCTNVSVGQYAHKRIQFTPFSSGCLKCHNSIFC